MASMTALCLRLTSGGPGGQSRRRLHEPESNETDTARQGHVEKKKARERKVDRRRTSGGTSTGDGGVSFRYAQDGLREYMMARPNGQRGDGEGEGV
jgi:hypothetical protein